RQSVPSPLNIIGTIKPLDMAGDKEAKGNHKIKEFLCGKTKLYQIIKFLGEGTYGKVAQCINVSTQEKIAVKIVRKDMPWAAKKELAMLGQLTGLQQNENNLVRFVEHFTDDGHVCLAFEMLDMSLYDMMKESCFEPLQLSEIRVITQQMLVALNSLKSIGLAHADIKPDNVMLVNHKLQPFKVKLIDFGQAFLVSKKPRNILIQGLGYRAPEVILGLPLNEAIDMWGLGCLLAFLYLGKHLYPTRCDRAKVFFKKEKKGSHTSIWRLNTPAEYKLATFCDNRITKGVFEKLTSLDDLAKIYPEVKDGPEYQDTLAFISLLKGMLQVDAERRITPSQALGKNPTQTHANKKFGLPAKSSGLLTPRRFYFHVSVANPRPLVLSHTGTHRKRQEVFTWDNLSNEHEEVIGLNIFRQSCFRVII
uniref:Protein kinase domain-containing protein n=1 Tax=Dicentrarchus labrax TaxID=13489 RepID=A0A8C4GS07_DICLA